MYKHLKPCKGVCVCLCLPVHKSRGQRVKERIISQTITYERWPLKYINLASKETWTSGYLRSLQFSQFSSSAKKVKIKPWWEVGTQQHSPMAREWHEKADIQSLGSSFLHTHCICQDTAGEDRWAALSRAKIKCYIVFLSVRECNFLLRSSLGNWRP